MGIVRKRSFLFTSDTIDILCLVYSIFNTKKQCLKYVDVRSGTIDGIFFIKNFQSQSLN